MRPRRAWHVVLGTRDEPRALMWLGLRGKVKLLGRSEQILHLTDEPACGVKLFGHG